MSEGNDLDGVDLANPEVMKQVMDDSIISEFRQLRAKVKELRTDREQLLGMVDRVQAENEQLREFIGDDIKNFVSGAFKKEAQE